MAGEKQINFIWSHLVPLWKIIKVFLNCLFSSFGWNKLILEIPDLRIWQIYPFFAALEFSILIHVREIIFLACKTGRRFCSRSSLPQVFLRKGVVKICSKVTGKHPCRSVILIKLLCNFIEITLRHGFSPVNLLHTFRTTFPENTFGWLLLLFPNKIAARDSCEHTLIIKLCQINEYQKRSP